MTANLKHNKLSHMLRSLANTARHGLLAVTQHSLALIGLTVVTVALAFTSQPGWQDVASDTLLGWMNMRQASSQLVSPAPTEPTPADRSTATTVQSLSSDQIAVTHWLSRKYKISPEPLAALVTEAWVLGERSQIAPTLILAVIAIESRFNPFASGRQGGMGLMQIEPEAHSNALSAFGGRLAAFDPLTNLRVGTLYLQDLIQSSGTLEDALRQYGLASGQAHGNQYVGRVLNEQKLLDSIANHASSTLTEKHKPDLLQTPLAQM